MKKVSLIILAIFALLAALAIIVCAMPAHAQSGVNSLDTLLLADYPGGTTVNYTLVLTVDPNSADSNTQLSSAPGHCTYPAYCDRQPHRRRRALNIHEIAEEVRAHTEDAEGSMLRQILENQQTIIQQNKEILQTMADTQADLDAAITAVQTAITQLGTDLTAEITALEAKAAGSGIDFTPEVTNLNNIATALQGFDAQAVAAEGTPAPPAPPAA